MKQGLLILMAITLLLPVHAWAADPPTEHNIASCDAACQATAPMTVDGGVMDVNFNYTAPVEVIGGVMDEGFTSIWWLTDSCTLSTSYAQAVSNAAQLLCDDIAMPAGSGHGWVFWLVAPTATADLADDQWWNIGAYELMWYQVAGAPASVDPAVMSEFNDLGSFIAMTSDQLLIKELEDAKSAYEKGQPCTAANALGAFLDHANDLIRGNEVVIAEELRNRGWMLRHNLLGSLPQGVSCPGFEDVGAAAELNIRQSNNQKFGSSVVFGKPSMQTVQAAGQVWTQVEIPSLQSRVGEPGMPGVPTWQTLLAVPMGAEVYLNTASPKVGEEIPLHLYPFQDQAADVELTPFEDEFANPPFEINESAYAQKGFYPADPCSIAIVGQVRDLAIAQLTCSAGQYNPETQSMRFFDSVDSEVVFDGGNGAFITSQSLSPFEESSQVGIAAVANREVVRDHVLVKDWSKLICIGEELLILTHPYFRDAAEDLAKWKREKGISTTIMEVGAGTLYDEGEEIDDLIEWRYDNCIVRPSYILLLGDVEFVPPARQDVDTRAACWLCGDVTTGSDYSYAIYPHFFFDIFPDFGVARISVDTADEAQLVVDKIIQYESDPPFVDWFSGAPFYTTAAFASQFQCCRMNWDGTPLSNQPGTDQRGFIETSELVRNQLTDSGYTVERIYTETVDLNYNGNTTPNRYYNGTLLPTDLRSGSGFPWSGSTADIIDAFNDGRFLILHRDHGSSAGFSHPSFKTGNLWSLTNDELLPVVYSVNCASGWFDRETDTGGTTESFMEQLLLVDDGGMVGGLGDNRNSPTWANNALTRGFFDATWTGMDSTFGDDDSCRRLGDILNHGKIYLLSQVGVTQTAGSISLDAALGELSMWHAFGDPTLEMWTSNPHKFLLVKSVNFEFLKDRLVVKYPISGAVITALQETDEGTVPIGRATVEDGVATIFFFAEPVQNVPIRLSASFENAVSVLLSSGQQEQGPDLVVEEIQLDSTTLTAGTDLAGLLKIKVGNLGDATAPGTLNSDDGGYMIDVVLSADTVVPEGYATPADTTGTIFSEDALLTGGRVSNTPDVAATSNVILTTGSPVSSDVGGIIPSQTPPGSYYLCTRIDPGEAVQETNEENNLTCRQITVVSPQQGPDLVVEEIQLDSTTLTAGTDLSNAEVMIKVGNLGIVDAPGTLNWGTEGYMVDMILSTDTVVPEGWATPADTTGTVFQEDALLTGGRVSNTPDVPASSSVLFGAPGIIPSQTPPGSYYLCARIDPGDAVQETNEENNLTCRQIRVRGAINNPPQATITFPADGDYLSPTVIALRGNGYDPEDGVLSGSSLRWYSDKDGYLGEGTYLRVHLSGKDCSFKDHTITLEVTDSDGAKSTHSITIHVGSLC